ncbi:MAG: response regulator [Candidatus Rokubacteria bacterium]|nr:response regulator [Candidatus Rokubacteria bacterium]
MTLHGTRILVVDDVSSVRTMLASLLRIEGADVVESETGWRAAELVRERLFDVAISDLGLPDIPGDVLIAHIRAASKGRTRVAALTGYGEPHQTRAREAGAESVFTKPVDWETILAFVTPARAPDIARSHRPVAPALDLRLSA